MPKARPRTAQVLAAAAVLPAAIWLTTDSAMMTAAACVSALFIFIRHQDNLKRLVTGKEPEFELKKNRSPRES